MSQVTLRVIGFGGQPVSDGDCRAFDERGGTIGRSAACDWVLPDPEHFLSSRHAALVVEDDEVLLIDTSTNGVFINHAPDPVGPDRTVPLHDGDTITMGDYELVVELGMGGAPLLAAAAPVMAAAAARSTSDLADPLDLLSPSAPSTVPRSENLRPSPRRSTPSVTGFGAPTTDMDAMDPLALLEGGGGSRIPDDFDLMTPGGASRADDAPITSAAFQPPRAFSQTIPDDWDDLLEPGPPSATAAPATRPAPSRPQPAEAPAVPRPDREARPAAPARSDIAPPTGGGPQAGEAVAAFLRGAGVDPAGAAGLEPLAALELAGSLFALAMEGLREVLMARTSLKSGFRMDMTYVAAVDNNPLKFAAGGADEVIEKLLFRRSKGYLAPRDAIEEAFNDMKDHQVGIIAGLRAGFDEMLRQFDPATLEKRFEAAGKRGLLSNRKAQNWESYTEWYAELVKSVDETYEKLFGEAFADAYQEQTRRNAGLHEK